MSSWLVCNSFLQHSTEFWKSKQSPQIQCEKERQIFLFVIIMFLHPSICRARYYVYDLMTLTTVYQLRYPRAKWKRSYGISAESGKIRKHPHIKFYASREKKSWKRNNENKYYIVLFNRTDYVYCWKTTITFCSPFYRRKTSQLISSRWQIYVKIWGCEDKLLSSSRSVHFLTLNETSCWIPSIFATDVNKSKLIEIASAEIPFNLSEDAGRRARISLNSVEIFPSLFPLPFIASLVVV